MIVINSNSIMSNKGLIPVNNLSEDTKKNINDIKSFLCEQFGFDRISQLFILEDKIGCTSKGVQTSVLFSDLSEENMVIINQIKETLNN